MGDIDSLIKTTGGFYEKSSVFIPNKFIVKMRGEYIDQAISLMEKYIGDEDSDSKDKLMERFERWKTIHIKKEPINIGGTTKLTQVLDLKWACDDITIPTVMLSGQNMGEDKYMALDPVKNMSFFVVTDYNHNNILNMTIIEDSNLMWYNFINALQNTFFETKLTQTARDSVRKLQIYISVLQFYYGQDDLNQSGHPKHEEVCNFEFNSVSLTSGGDSLNYKANADQFQKYKLTFVAPNPFQKPFKHQEDGLLDVSSDSINVVTRKENRVINRSSFEARDGITRSYDMYEGNAGLYKKDSTINNSNNSNSTGSTT